MIMFWRRKDCSLPMNKEAVTKPDFRDRPSWTSKRRREHQAHTQSEKLGLCSSTITTIRTCAPGSGMAWFLQSLAPIGLNYEIYRNAKY